MLERKAIPGQLAPVMDLWWFGEVKSLPRYVLVCWVGPVGRSDYWRDGSARD